MAMQRGRTIIILLLAGLAPTLGGCVAGMAMSAAGMAVRGTRGESVSNEHLRPAAAQACSVHAAQYGAVHIIDVEQRSPGRLIVWGTVDDGREKRSFECGYGTKVIGFKLRPIKR